MQVPTERDTGLLIRDRGLCYGDGLFETMRAESGVVPLLDRHLERLMLGLERLRIPAPDENGLAELVRGLARERGTGVVKLVVTRGEGGRGYRPPDIQAPRVLATSTPLAEIPRRHYSEGIALQVCSTRIGRSPATAGLKHLGRLEQVLASAELGEEYPEGVMLDEADRLIEGTRSNLFVVRDGALGTPGLLMSGVAGVMRSLVMDSAGALGLECAEEDLGLSDLAGADEVFTTNAVAGIWPVSRIDAVGWSRPPGHVTRRLMQVAAASGVPAWAP